MACVSDDPAKLSELILDVFKTIAVVFQPQGYSSTQLVLQTKAREVADRIVLAPTMSGKTLAKPKVASIASASNAPLVPHDTSDTLPTASGSQRNTSGSQRNTAAQYSFDVAASRFTFAVNDKTLALQEQSTALRDMVTKLQDELAVSQSVQASMVGTLRL